MKYRYLIAIIDFLKKFKIKIKEIYLDNKDYYRKFDSFYSNNI